jgi:hypothetical protein
MLSTLLTVTLSLTTLSFASTVPDYRRDAGLLKLSVAALNVSKPYQLSKRQNSLPTVNTGTGTYYVVNCEFSIIRIF